MKQLSQLNFNDIFKSNFLEKASSISILDMGISLLLAFIIGMFIFIVYKKTFRGVMYSDNFGASLLIMTMITTLVILAITSNVILSLGMVGALSIVRFRSAVKDPLDIAFIFWAICSGIIVGAGLIPLAVIGSVIVGVIMIVFVNRKSSSSPYILVVNCDDDHVEAETMVLINKSVKKAAIKSKTVSMGKGIELTIEVKLQDGLTEFVNTLGKITGVNNVALVSYNGEFMS